MKIDVNSLGTWIFQAETLLSLENLSQIREII